MKIRVPRTFIPPEAHSIANNFRQTASEVRRLAGQLNEIGNTLNATWEGRSKNNFMGEFNPEPGNLNSFADYLESCAQNVERMTVTVWEEKEVGGL